MVRTAIFGANGYIGRHLTRYLQQLGIVVKLYDVQNVSVDCAIPYYRCDVTNTDWWQTFTPTDFDSILFMSGLSGPERSFQFAEEYEDVNVRGLMQLLHKISCLGKNAPKIIFPSSRLVYRGGGSVTEDSPVEARSVYAANKIACEALLSAYHHRYDIPYVAFRICVPYGNLISKDYSYGTVGFFMRQVLSGEPITVYGDGQYTKTYTYIEDICKIFHASIANSGISGVYNIGGHDYTLKEVASMIAKAHNGRIEYVPWPESAQRVEMGNISLNSTRLADAMGYVEYRRMEDLIDVF